MSVEMTPELENLVESILDAGGLVRRCRRLLKVVPAAERTSRPLTAWSAAVLFSILAALIGTTLTVTNASYAEDEGERVAPADKNKPAEATTVNDILMQQVIKAVKENEDRYRNLETIVKTTFRWKPRGGSAGFRAVAVDADGKSTEKVFEETLHTVLQGDLLHFRDEETIRLNGVRMAHFKRLSTYDGKTTKSIEYDNSANVHFGRYESARIVPPHSWGFFHSGINLPLSVYLSGTEAVRQHPKFRAHPRETGSIYEVSRVEAHFEKEEVVNGLKCLKIRVLRWSLFDGQPVTRYLWLALDRNYLCVKSQALQQLAPDQHPADESQVEKLKQIAPGIWLPTRVTTKRYGGLNEKKPYVSILQTLTVEKAVVNPGHPREFFSHVKIPPGIPVYVIKDERLVNSVLEKLKPPADHEKRLAAVVENVRTNEKLYGKLGVKMQEIYHNFHAGESGLGRSYSTRHKQQESIVKTGKGYFLEKESNNLGGGHRIETTDREAFDGSFSRRLWTGDRTKSGKTSTRRYAILKKGGFDTLRVHRPHMLTLRKERKYKPLSKFLTSGWWGERHRNRLRVTYLGDDDIGDLDCHRLRIETGSARRATFPIFQILWLAKARNYLPVRRELYEPGRSEHLPTGITVVDEMRQIGPGVWYPFRTTHYAFQKSASTGLCEGRLIVNYKTVYQVKEATLNPEPAVARFETVEVPAGTDVRVLDERGKDVGKYKQKTTGNLSITPERYLELRDATKKKKRIKRG